jgi:hypothetical protein
MLVQWIAYPPGGTMTRKLYPVRVQVMCRSIKTLFNFEPPATQEEIRSASIQFVRKLSGFNSPSKINGPAFDRAVAEVSAAAHALIASLVTNAEPRDRQVEAARAKARGAVRFNAR